MFGLKKQLGPLVAEAEETMAAARTAMPLLLAVVGATFVLSLMTFLIVRFGRD